VRKELVITLSHLVLDYLENFKAVALEYAHDGRLYKQETRELVDTNRRVSSEVKIAAQPSNLVYEQLNSLQFSSVYLTNQPNLYNFEHLQLRSALEAFT